MSVSRRNFLKGAAAGAAGTALAGGVLIGGARADGSTAQAPSAPRSYPFHGTHQAGVLTPGPAGKQSFACFVICQDHGTRALPRPRDHLAVAVSSWGVRRDPSS